MTLPIPLVTGGVGVRFFGVRISKNRTGVKAEALFKVRKGRVVRGPLYTVSGEDISEVIDALVESLVDAGRLKR